MKKFIGSALLTTLVVMALEVPATPVADMNHTVGNKDQNITTSADASKESTAPIVAPAIQFEGC